MSYPSEGALRLQDPDKFDTYKRTNGGIVNGINIPAIISIIWGHIKDTPKDAFQAQALRFPIKYWKEKDAKKWIDDNIKEYITWEPAAPLKPE